MSKLDDILKEHREWMRGIRTDRLIGTSNDETKQQIKDLMLELIGEDEVRPESGPQRNGTAQGVRRAGNKVRRELRQKVESL